jgi:hypothetical protein
MKKLVLGTIIGILISGMVYASGLIAEVATFKVYINGNEFKSDKAVAVINGSTYLPLKAIGEALGVNVSWNSEKKCVDIGEDKEVIEFKNFNVTTKYDYTTVLGEITNNDYISHTISYTVTFYDESGKILGTATGFTSDLKPLETRTFEALSMDDYSNYKTFKIQIDNLYAS